LQFLAFYKDDIKCTLKGKHSSSFVNGAILSKNNTHQEIKTIIKHIGRKNKKLSKNKMCT
jgi:Uncharacterized protein family (UPF0051).